MQINRRDLLKYFGIGSTIVPVLGGVPKIEAPARLISEPEIEPVKLVEAGLPPLAFGLDPVEPPVAPRRLRRRI